MKDTKELESRLYDELQTWFKLQCRDQFTDFYLYFKPSAPNVPGDLRIQADRPAGFQLVQAERIDKASTVSQNFHRIANGALRRIPVLDWGCDAN